MKNSLYRLANELYKQCYPVYYPLYSSWKAYADKRERAILRQLINPGMTVVDVGANIGIYTRFFSKLTGQSGHVVAFEPSPGNYQRLQENVRHLQQVTAHHAAVGKSSGNIQLFISEAMNVDHRTYDNGDGRDAITVPMVSLDDHFAKNGKVDIIKIDVQGFELNVLEGARRVLKENRNISVLMEFWPYGLAQASTNPAEVIDLVRVLGFNIRNINDSAGHSFDPATLNPAEINHYCNLLLTR